MDDETRTRVEAAAFRRLVAHLQERKDVQNIELMELAGFCRNCLSKWYAAAATEAGHVVEPWVGQNCGFEIRSGDTVPPPTTAPPTTAAPTTEAPD